MDAHFQLEEFEPIKLEVGDSRVDVELDFNITEEHAVNKWGKAITEKGSFKILLRLLDNEPFLSESVVTVYDGGVVTI